MPAPTTLPPPEVVTGADDGAAEASELVVVTRAEDSLSVTAVDDLSAEPGTVEPAMIPPHRHQDLEPPPPPEEVQTEEPPEAEGTPSVVEPPTPASSAFPLPTAAPVDQPETSEPSFDLHQDQIPTPAPTPEAPTEAESPNSEPDSLPQPTEETDAHSESAVQPENDTATFSATTVLSGDGEVDQAPPLYPHLLDTDSELDYQYDPADALLPVSLAAAASLLLLLLLPLLLLLLSSLHQLLLKAACKTGSQSQQSASALPAAGTKKVSARLPLSAPGFFFPLSSSVLPL